ncbi:hypothetical protein TNCV_4344061 [Trichonephila clavipes]|nr:hypothetical protein TNCV_4344061 [Trichonephila clavipes]
MSSNLVPLKICPVEWTMHVKYVEAQTSFRRCGVEVRSGVISLGVVRVTSPWFKLMKSDAKSLRVTE